MQAALGSADTQAQRAVRLRVMLERWSEAATSWPTPVVQDQRPAAGQGGQGGPPGPHRPRQPLVRQCLPVRPEDRRAVGGPAAALRRRQRRLKAFRPPGQVRRVGAGRPGAPGEQNLAAGEGEAEEAQPDSNGVKAGTGFAWPAPHGPRRPPPEGRAKTEARDRRRSGRSRGDLTSTLHAAVCGVAGQPLNPAVTRGQPGAGPPPAGSPLHGARPEEEAEASLRPRPAHRHERRNGIERLLRGIKGCRRAATRYEKKAASFASIRLARRGRQGMMRMSAPPSHAFRLRPW